MRSLPLFAVSTVLAASTALLCACASPPTYLRPDLTPHDARAEVQSGQANILGAAVVALAADGYPIAGVDNDKGVLTTAPRPVVVTEAEADCGKEKVRARTKDPLNVSDPDTYVAFTVLAGQGYIVVRATIEDRRNPFDEKTPLVCTSRGTLEKVMLNEIKARL
jgi:hypothetical protein